MSGLKAGGKGRSEGRGGRKQQQQQQQQQCASSPILRKKKAQRLYDSLCEVLGSARMQQAQSGGEEGDGVLFFKTHVPATLPVAALARALALVLDFSLVAPARGKQGGGETSLPKLKLRAGDHGDVQEEDRAHHSSVLSTAAMAQRAPTVGR